MSVLARIVGVAIIVVGIAAIVAPLRLFTVGATLVTPGGLIVAATIRVAIGLVLLTAARGSRFPRVFQVVGVIIVIAGLATPLFGVDRARTLMDWFAASGPSAVRLVAAIAVLIGAFIAYAAGPSHRTRISG